MKYMLIVLGLQQLPPSQVRLQTGQHPVAPLLKCLLLSPPENDRPSSLVLEVIDYNMPLTTTYMKQMKLQCMNNNKVREVKQQTHWL